MTRRASSFELVLPPRPEGVPSFHWLRNALRTEILNGRIMPGSKLPASRELARQYQLSRGTILAALDELQAEGYLEGRRGSGTYVSQILPEHLLPSQQVADQELARTRRKGRISPPSPRGCVRSRCRSSRRTAPSAPTFRRSISFPPRCGRSSRADVCARLPPGSAGLRGPGISSAAQAIADYAHTSRGIQCAPEQIIVVSGVQEGLDLAARLLLNPGDKVLVEDPGYQGAYAVFGAIGARIVSMRLDAEGAAPKEADFRGCRSSTSRRGTSIPSG